MVCADSFHFDRLIRSRITRKNAANVLPLLQGLQACPSRKINFSQLFMHITIDFKAAVSKLWLLRHP